MARTGDWLAFTDPGRQLNQLDSVPLVVAALLENGFPPASQSTPSEGSQSTDAAGEIAAEPAHPQDDQALVH